MSQLELRGANLVPRPSTRIVVCDGDGGGLAARGAARLQHFDYSDVAVLEGGTDAWEKAGFETFSGMNVPSKLFGEFVEHHYNTPSLSAEELQSKIDAGEDLVIVDSRPRSEYEAMSIPGSTCIPGAELVYRIREAVPNVNTLVVVNCAGRTRSIVGAQSLSSVEFRKGHIDGAIHAIRGRISERLGALAEHELLVLTAGNDLLARYAYEEASKLTSKPVNVLRGGNEAWLAQGLRMVTGNDGLEDDAADAFLRPYDRDKSVEEAMQSYLDWEIALMDKLDKDGTVAFKTA